MPKCPHFNRIGDNYGITCLDCGEALEGYGYWAEGSKVCHHNFVPETPESNYEVCLYCQAERRRAEAKV